MRPVFQLDPADAGALGGLRATTGWEACLTPDRLWARGPAGAEDDPAARILPCLARYVEHSPGFLTPLGATLPAARTPPGPWRALADFLAVEHPVPWLAAEFLHPATLPSPRRDDSPREPGALRLPLAALAAWAETAPQARLDRLCFAASATGEAFVAGAPLPPLPGETWWFDGPLALPAGWAPPAAARADWIARALGLRAGDWALLAPDGGVGLIRAEFRLPLRRSSLRRTLARPTGGDPPWAN